MKAAVLRKPYEIKIEDVPKPEIHDGEALVRVKSVGICGTDVLVFKGLYKNKFPIIPGHEFSGIVEEIRGGTRGIKAGDKVYSKGSWGCGKCEFCLSGRQALCKDRVMLGVSANGCMAEYVKVDSSVLYPLSDEVSFDDAQSIVSISCAINLTTKLKYKLGMNVVVMGPGHNGLIIMQVLRHIGADNIVVIGGSRESRIKLASDLGANLALSGKDPGLMEKIKKLMPDGPDVVIESTGSAQAINQAVSIVKTGGTVMAYSIYPGPLENFQINELYNKDISIFGVKGAGNYYEDAERLLQKKAIQIKPIISHNFSLDETQRAFEVMADKTSDAIRVVINP